MQRPRAGAVDEDVAGLQQRQRLVRSDVRSDALDGPGGPGVDQLAQGLLDDVQRHEPARPLLEQRAQVPATDRR